jgi:RimJ/RimL family protein N-acetyltransferase
MDDKANDVDVRFRRLTDADLPMLHAWLNEPGVVRWWEGEDVSWEAVVRDYGSGGDEPTEHWIAVVDGRDAGWLQCYAWADHPDEDETKAHWAAGVDRGAAGIDYLVAGAGHRNQGIGSAMIRAFVRDVVFARHPTWTQVSAGPFVANTASWRALARAGFRHLADYDSGDDDGPCRVMALDRTVPADG